jgi:hypothetical protein
MADLKIISANLDTAKSVNIEVVCKVYSKKNGDLLSSVNTGIIKSGKSSLTIFDDVEIFTTENVSAFIDKNNSSITVLSKSKVKEQVGTLEDKGIDQFVKWVKSQSSQNSFNPVLISNENNIRVYSIKDFNDLKEMLISIDIQSKSILKISYEYTDSSEQKQKFIELNYKKFLINDAATKLVQSDYFILKSGKYSAGNKFKSFSITTNI